MRLAPLAAALAALAGTAAEAKAVFAHYMVGNVRELSQADWEADMGAAQASGLDGFVLNVAWGDDSVPGSVARGFAAAEAVARRGGPAFRLFFSFDYQGGPGGAWPAPNVTALLDAYKDKAVYYQQAPGRPLVSTFEGAGSRGDWAAIKTATGAYFVPDWDSLDPREAVASGVVDGLFNWDAWPTGAADKTTAKDEAYRAALGAGRTYMMGVSPWFYTHVYGKNWLWRGDDLWFDRWQQVLALQPDLVQVITWNDFGESHYIGPLSDKQYGLFADGGAPYNYVADMPHDGWRQFLPYLIAQYKTGAARVDREGLTTWYRRSPAAACQTGGTTANDGGHGQTELPPAAVVQDRVFFTALLRGPARVTVTIGGQAKEGVWESTPADGGAGLYHGSVPFDGRTGPVVVALTRDGDGELARVDGADISTASCTNGITNWNAWVGSAAAGGSGGGGNGGTAPSPSTTPSPSPTNPPADDDDSKPCVQGTGEGNMAGLCEFACHYNYCPGDCTCTKRGDAAVSPPPATGQKGYPAVGVANPCAYLGLCSYAWDRGYTDNRSACGPDPAGAEGC